METVCAFETSQNTFPPTQCHNPQDQNHRPDGRENIKTQNTTLNFELRACNREYTRRLRTGC